MFDLGEGKGLASGYVSALFGALESRVTYCEFLDNTRDTLDCQVLEREHRLVALDGLLVLARSLSVATSGESHVESCQVLPVFVEGLVVELGELL